MWGSSDSPKKWDFRNLICYTDSIIWAQRDLHLLTSAGNLQNQDLSVITKAHKGSKITSHPVTQRIYRHADYYLTCIIRVWMIFWQSCLFLKVRSPGTTGAAINCDLDHWSGWTSHDTGVSGENPQLIVNSTAFTLT